MGFGCMRDNCITLGGIRTLLLPLWRRRQFEEMCMAAKLTRGGHVMVNLKCHLTGLQVAQIKLSGHVYEGVSQ